ncbi:MAG: hypothetical protein QXU48_08630 [Thermoplasmata archaeon]
MRKLFLFLFIFFLATISFVHINAPAESAPSDRYLEHAPIKITSKSEFTKENGVVGGCGTANDPFIIEGWKIVNAIEWSGIYVRCSTEVFYIIRNCFVVGCHITLYADNGLIMDNIIYNPDYNASGYGIYIGARNIVIYNNTITAYYAGVEVTKGWDLRTDSQNIQVISNNITSLNGVDLQHVSNARVESNHITGFCGVMDGESENGKIISNNFYIVQGCAINGRNEIHHNNFHKRFENGVLNKSLGEDRSGRSIWYDPERKEGNYWYNWDGKGWGTENAYPINGSNVSDYYPLRTPLENQTIFIKYNKTISMSEKIKVYVKNASSEPLRGCGLSVEFVFDAPAGVRAYVENAQSDENGSAEVDVEVNPNANSGKHLVVLMIKSNKSGYLNSSKIVILTVCINTGSPLELNPLVITTLLIILLACFIGYVFHMRKKRRGK